MAFGAGDVNMPEIEGESGTVMIENSSLPPGGRVAG
jgi:hypothetical protein